MVVICLGPINLKDKTTLEEGSRNIVAAMKKHGVERVVFISCAGVDESWKKIPWSSKLLFSTMLKGIMQSHKQEEAIIKASGLNWTAVRPAVLTSKPSHGVVASNEVKTNKISREALAEFLVEQVDSTEYENMAISVTDAKSQKE